MTSGQVQSVLPRWRGFNLTDGMSMNSSGDFREEEFAWIAEFGFDFVRIPLCYRLWIHGDDPFRVNETWLGKLDRVVELGRRYKLHVCLNFHRAPGFSVNRDWVDPSNLWKDREPLEAFCFHWYMLAQRYRGIASEALSFNLVNEPESVSEKMSRDDHARVIRAATSAIREVDPERLIIVDGLRWGRQPSPELADLGVGQSCRAYDPFPFTHYKATWVDSTKFPEPVWPGPQMGDEHWDRERLKKHYEPWVELARQGVGVHCGEGGVFRFTPHQLVLAWWRDVLEVLREANIGYAVWNFRGPFGVLDSQRDDVSYEDWHGHKLDRKLLKLLQAY